MGTNMDTNTDSMGSCNTAAKTLNRPYSLIVKHKKGTAKNMTANKQDCCCRDMDIEDNDVYESGEK